MGEFDLIRRHFTRPPGPGASVRLGVGDDCALLDPSPTFSAGSGVVAPAGPLSPVALSWAISTDLLVEGRHFLSTVSPRALGHKSLAVNLSDLAACGARPRGCTLSLAMPRVDDGWLAEFAAGFYALADRYGCPLVGGDTTAGPLTIGVTVFGEVPAPAALLRSTARPGDDLWVSGSVGGARLALEVFRGQLSVSEADFADARRAMEWPEPRVTLGGALVGIAHAAIDISDGLLGDLRHVLDASGVGARLWVDQVPVPPAVARLGQTQQRQLALAGGDDYELLFTAPAMAREAIQTAAQASATPVRRIGHVRAEQGLELMGDDGQVVSGRFASFDHFSEP